MTTFRPSAAPRRALRVGFLAMCITGALAAQPTASRPSVYDPPTTPLDARIEAARITRTDPPPLPEQVVLPMPPWFRIASRPEEVPISAEHWARAHVLLERGLTALLDRQGAQGAWMAEASTAPTDQPDATSPIGVAVTALATKALVQSGRTDLESGPVAEAVRYILRARRDDGSFEAGALSNYVTATVVSALAGIPDVAVAQPRERARLWLVENQWDQSEGVDAGQDWFGGAGYGTHGRPDLSNTQIMLDAMYDCGMSPDEPAFQRALAFVSRAQNLKATNGAEWAGDDGGFIYTPANGGESMASEYAGEGRHGEHRPETAPPGLRSYGSMTYAGFKSMLHAGLSADDVRVRAAFDWMRRHWTFDENPGLGEQGLYYYYHTVARALAVGQQTTITDLDGVAHNWREELIDALARRQQEDGSWVNGTDRWLEANAALATTYAVLALQEALKPVTATGIDIVDTPSPRP